MRFLFGYAPKFTTAVCGGSFSAPLRFGILKYTKYSGDPEALMREKTPRRKHLLRTFLHTLAGENGAADPCAVLACRGAVQVRAEGDASAAGSGTGCKREQSCHGQKTVRAVLGLGQGGYPGKDLS